MANDWTRFRGPNGSGIGEALGLPETLSPSLIRWKTTLPGEGHSAPVVSQGRLFVTSAEEKAGKRSLHCLETRSGKLLWSQSFPFTAYHTHEFNTAASATAVLDNRAVYTTWPAAESFLIAAHTYGGKELWRRALGAFPTQHGGAASPIRWNDLLIVPHEPEDTPGSILALDAATGKTRWELARPSEAAPYSAPLLYAPPGGPPQLIFSSTKHGVTSLDPATGTLNWELPELFKLRCVGSPILADGLIVASSGVGGGDRLLVALRPGPRGEKPTVAYRLTRTAPYVPTPLAVGTELYLWGDGGIVTATTAATGAPLWQERVGGNYFGSPVFSEGRIYALSARGELVAIQAGKTFAIVGRLELGEPSHSTPAIAEKTLFVRTRSQVFALRARG